MLGLRVGTPPRAARFRAKKCRSISQEDLNEQACDLCRGTWPSARLCHIVPNSAEAGWRARWGWGGPGVNVYVGPRYGYYAPLLPAVRSCLQLSLRLLPLLARPLLSRLVLARAPPRRRLGLKGHSPKGVAFRFSASGPAYWSLNGIPSGVQRAFKQRHVEGLSVNRRIVAGKAGVANDAEKTLMAAATLASYAWGDSPVSAHDRNDNWDNGRTGTMAGTGRTTTSTTITVTSRSLTTRYGYWRYRPYPRWLEYPAAALVLAKRTPRSAHAASRARGSLLTLGRMRAADFPGRRLPFSRRLV
jgi:hypothetical protein